MSIQYLAAAIEKKHGAVADTAVKKDGTWKVTRWDESIAGVPQPSDAELIRLAADYASDEIPRLKKMEQIAETDKRMARSVEDLIDTLINKSAIAITDLPPETQAILAERKQLRSQITRG